jgi:hypothetical protein
MFKFDQHFRRRVHLAQRNGGLSVRIERQNTRGLYFWMLCLSTAIFALFVRTIWDATVLHPQDTLYIAPIFLLGVALYVLALVYALWGAFGVEEIFVEAGTLRWTLTAFRWSRTRVIQVDDITGIKAVTPWYGLDNTVEITTPRKRQLLGDKLLPDEAVELAHKLSQVVGCHGS